MPSSSHLPILAEISVSSHHLTQSMASSADLLSEKHDSRESGSSFQNPSPAGISIPHNPHAITPTPISSPHNSEYKANPTSTLEKTDKWQGRDRRQLSEKGYGTLALLATFMAATQSQVLSSTLSNTGPSSGLVNAFFIASLLANIFGAILSYASSRWFEMLTKDESAYLHTCWVDAEVGTIHRENHPAFVDRWTSLSIKMGPFAVVLGLIFFVLGFLVFIWTEQPLVVRVISTIVCCVFLVLIPPFTIRHNRMAVLGALRLKRRG